MHQYTLGPLPWNEDVLRKAYFQNFIETRKVIQEHPGFLVHQDLCVLQLSLEIFLDSVSDLMQSINSFRYDAQSINFWTRPSQSRFEQRELSIRRGVFAAVTSAISLVDHSRVINNKISIKGYWDQIKESFSDNAEHRFVQGLRNYISHVRMVEPDWRKNISLKGKSTRFLLQQDGLLKWDGWHPLARSFVDSHPEGIDVEFLFDNYRNRVLLFQDWFHSEIARVSEPALSEYRQYERLLNRFDTKTWWSMILKQVISQRLDPFNYLDRYLTKAELDEILAMPMRSKMQIDRIIEILDEYDVCDAEIRGKIYKACGLSIPNNKTQTDCLL